MLYGAPMSPGLTPEAAAERFWQDHGDTFRGRHPELQRRWAITPTESNKTIFAYHQTIRGTPVEGANARLMVTSRAGVCRVNYVSAQLAGEPTIGTEFPLVPAQLASIFVQSRPGYGTLSVIGEPERVVLLGSGERGDAWAWRVKTVQTDSPYFEPRTFFVSTGDLRVLYVRSDRVAAQSVNTITVQVEGKALSNHEPHTTSNTPVWTPLPEVRFEWSEVGQGVWDASFAGFGGTVSQEVGALTEVDVRSTLGQTLDTGGIRVVIMDFEDDDNAGTYYCNWGYGNTAASTTAQHPAPGAQLLQFAGDDEFTVAQMNAVVYFSRSYQYLYNLWGLDPPPGFFDTLRVGVNGRGDWFGGNAEYSKGSSCGDNVPSFMFGATGRGNRTGYRNMAYSSVIAHEFGHYVLDRLIGIPGGAFGEGFADSYWIVMSGDPIIGRAWHVSDPFIRHPVQSGCVAGNINQPECPCDQGGHMRGQVLGRVWTHIMDEFIVQYGGNGPAKAQELHTIWMLLTLGYTPIPGYLCESAFEDTVMEVLVADDDDDDLYNGTPNCVLIICPAFTAVNLPCDEDLSCR
jgi:hypothetical protein